MRVGPSRSGSESRDSQPRARLKSRDSATLCPIQPIIPTVLPSGRFFFHSTIARSFRASLLFANCPSSFFLFPLLLKGLSPRHLPPGMMLTCQAESHWFRLSVATAEVIYEIPEKEIFVPSLIAHSSLPMRLKGFISGLHNTLA